MLEVIFKKTKVPETKKLVIITLILGACALFVACDKRGDDTPTAHAHTGGEATCESGAICIECGEEYGEPDVNAHSKSYEWSEGAIGSSSALNAGTHTCTVSATDRSGNTTTKTVFFHVLSTDVTVGTLIDQGA